MVTLSSLPKVPAAGGGIQPPQYVFHSIPFRPGKEDVFYNFSDFFQKTFCQPQREGQNA
jgi:hypothetical protein